MTATFDHQIKLRKSSGGTYLPYTGIAVGLMLLLCGLVHPVFFWLGGLMVLISIVYIDVNRRSGDYLLWNKTHLAYQCVHRPNDSWEILWREIKSIEYQPVRSVFLIYGKDGNHSFPEFKPEDANTVIIAIGTRLKDTAEAQVARPLRSAATMNGYLPKNSGMFIAAFVITSIIATSIALQMPFADLSSRSERKLFLLVFLIPLLILLHLFDLHRQGRLIRTFPDLARPETDLGDFFVHVTSRPAEFERFFRHLWLHAKPNHFDKWTKWVCKEYQSEIRRIRSD